MSERNLYEVTGDVKDINTLLVSREEWNRRAQPAQAVPASCGECGKKTSDGWALYCVACMEKAGLPAQAVPLLSDAEIDTLLSEPDGSAEADVVDVEVSPGVWGKEYSEVDAWSKPLVVQAIRSAEQAVRAKLGVAVPMTQAQIEHALRAEPMADSEESFARGVRAAERHHGIGDKP